MNMKLQLVSDIHSEFWDNPKRLFERITLAPDLDFLVAAGDFVVPARQPEVHVESVFEWLSKQAKHIILVEGNHEYYGGNYEFVTASLLASMPDNFHWLRNTEAAVEDIHFYGGAMWFNNADGLNHFYRNCMNDFRLIHNLEEWVYERNREFTENAERFVRPETIVVTHHLPHMLSVPERFKHEQTNRFFVSDQTDLIARKQPRLWFHGHTHEPCDYKLGETRVVCNPYGYPSELYKEYGEPRLEYPQVVIEI